ncbi:hypothetical protein [Terrimonas alba]|uniref:hypothetical protein n=1 Tax=Terrimonas alba TaxID=3349636 RepID=UPI0035F3F58B
MDNMYSLQKPAVLKHRHLAPVIHLLPVSKKRKKRKEGKVEENQLPQFYTEPIFKAKLHDFL